MQFSHHHDLLFVTLHLPLRPRCYHRHSTSVCTLPTPTPTPNDPLPQPRFARDSQPAPETSFFPTPKRPSTPNERLLSELSQTISDLGVTETAPPPPRKPVDISNVNPFAALLGAAGAGVISYVLWNVLSAAAGYFSMHTFDDQMYVVQRLGSVVRVGVVCLLALASGISGVTGLGLFLLAGRTGIAAVTGEFRSEEQED